MCGLVLASCFASPVALAQDDDPTRSAAARSLFQEGVGFADQERWSDAADRFERALDMRYSAVIAFNLATAFEEVGRVVEASEVLRQASRRQDATDEVRDAAEVLLERLAPRIAHLTVHITGEPTGATVLLDGRELPAPMWGVAAPVDGGEHLVVAERGEEELGRRSITVAEGGAAELSLELPGFPAVDLAVEGNGSQETEAPVEASSSGVLSSPWFWVVLGVVVVGGVTAGVAVGVSSGGEQEFMGNLPSIPIGGGG